MTDSDIKALVRHRDHYRCRDCGMTDQEHVAKNGRSLDVHRLLPGSNYSVDYCVTLCRSCHGKKPKTVGDAVSSRERGLAWIYFNEYDPEHARLLDQLWDVASERDIPVGALVQTILREHFEGRPPDYVI